jgi:MFS family permease
MPSTMRFEGEEALGTEHDDRRIVVLSDLAGPAVTLGAGVSAGFVAGLLIGGVGGRLAMLLLRITSGSEVLRTKTNDGFTIGTVSTETLFLLGVTAALGVLGGIFYVIVRGWFPMSWRVAAMTLFFGAVGASGVIGPSRVDFTLLSPLPLAFALFVLIPLAYGAVMPILAERLLRETSFLRRGRWCWVGSAPLAVLNVVGALILTVALGVWALARSVPAVGRVWQSPITTWLGRSALVGAVIISILDLVRDAETILS